MTRNDEILSRIAQGNLIRRGSKTAPRHSSKSFLSIRLTRGRRLGCIANCPSLRPRVKRHLQRISTPSDAVDLLLIQDVAHGQVGSPAGHPMADGCNGDAMRVASGASEFLGPGIEQLVGDVLLVFQQHAQLLPRRRVRFGKFDSVAALHGIDRVLACLWIQPVAAIDDDGRHLAGDGLAEPCEVPFSGSWQQLLAVVVAGGIIASLSVEVLVCFEHDPGSPASRRTLWLLPHTGKPRIR